jgi:hypothetical protein
MGARYLKENNLSCLSNTLAYYSFHTDMNPLCFRVQAPGTDPTKMFGAHIFTLFVS